MSHEERERCPIEDRMAKDETGAYVAPTYIRVRPGWLEKWLFVAVLVQIMLLAFFIAYGSIPARESRNASDRNTVLICQFLLAHFPEEYPQYDCPSDLDQ